MSIILFYIALVLLIGIITIKYFGMPIFGNTALSDMVSEHEHKIHKIAKGGKNFASKIKYKNFHKLVVMVADFLKKESIALKRRFDSQQPKFFLQVEKPSEKHKNSVSFFLRSVSEHKKSLKKKDL